MAAATASDLVKAARTVGIWNRAGGQTRALLDDEVQRLVVRGFFMNLAYCGNVAASSTAAGAAGAAGGAGAETAGIKQPEYGLLRTDQQSRAVIDRSSSLTTAASIAPWVCFGKLLQTTRAFISLVTPVQESWIAEESEEFAALVRQRVAKQPVTVVIDDITPGG